jgi:hypothetical protein
MDGLAARNIVPLLAEKTGALIFAAIAILALVTHALTRRGAISSAETVLHGAVSHAAHPDAGKS